MSEASQRVVDLLIEKGFVTHKPISGKFNPRVSRAVMKFMLKVDKATKDAGNSKLRYGN